MVNSTTYCPCIMTPLLARLLVSRLSCAALPLSPCPWGAGRFGLLRFCVPLILSLPIPTVIARTESRSTALACVRACVGHRVISRLRSLSRFHLQPSCRIKTAALTSVDEANHNRAINPGLPSASPWTQVIARGALRWCRTRAEKVPPSSPNTTLYQVIGVQVILYEYE
ncbi:hypothetical protein IWZ03DRAFT_136685 [Phyllosticta citriasiana]|uniref:Secreted protein n=1 Tax=Phyllosticta citriasiana TaxID=595635 RepID=A0ABR1KSB1_9PEZI